jgi:hypothetical protein
MVSNQQKAPMLSLVLMVSAKGRLFLQSHNAAAQVDAAMHSEHGSNFSIAYTSGIQPGVREDTLRFSFLSFKTYYLILYFGCNLFYLF